MRLMHPFILAAAAAALLSGCGGDDGSAAAAPAGTPDDYRATVAAQCDEANARRDALELPEVGSSRELAAYLRRTLQIQQDFRDNFDALTPPSELEDFKKQTLAINDELFKVADGNARAAAAGRDFDAVMTALEPGVNAVLRRANATFTRAGIPECEQELLDFGYSDGG
jgi:hypothetical protein